MANRTYDRVAVYRWRKSDEVNVAEPTGLDGSLAIGTEFENYMQQPGFRVIVTLNARGQQLLHELTAAAVEASHDRAIDTPERHLAVLVSLTDQQLASWSDTAVQQKALKPVEEGGNLLSNGFVVHAFTGNQLIIYNGRDLPTACSLSAMRTA